MKFRIGLLALSFLILTSCTGDDSPTIEELEASQAGVELQDSSEMKKVDSEITTTEKAKEVCAIQLSQIVGGGKNSTAVKQSCDCIVNRVSLSDINSKGVLQADKEATNECIGN